MTAAVFYAVVSGVSLLAIICELLYSKRRALGWHTSADTLGNFNLAAGNVMLGAVSAGLVLAGYQAFYELRVLELDSQLSTAACVIVAIVLSDFLSYWSHRLSHRWNILWWGHITHHSSSQMNLSTGIRVNWVYRSYVWLLFTPMALLGFSVEWYLLGQTVINVYNLFMHTRADVPFGPLGWVLVTPMSHRLHHSAHPEYFGNYGAALIIWDRLFGTYRELDQQAGHDLVFGIDQNVDSADPIRLNFHYLQQLWQRSRAEGRSFLGLLLSANPLPSRTRSAPPARDRVPRGWWYAIAVMILFALAVNQAALRLPDVGTVLVVALGVAASVGFGLVLQRRLSEPVPSAVDLGEVELHPGPDPKGRVDGHVGQ